MVIEAAKMEFQLDEAFSRELDQQDSLRALREEFHLPIDNNGKPLVYLCGNSLGLPPKAARTELETEFDKWATRGIEGYYLKSRLL